MSTTTLVFRSLFKWLLPAFLICGFIFRVNGFSLTYLLCLLAAGLCRDGGSPGNGQVAVVIVVLCVSGVSLVGGGLFQITRITDYAETDLQPCNGSEQIWRQVGFNQMKHFTSAEMAQYVVPDIGIFLLSLSLLVIGVYGKKSYKPSEDPEDAVSGVEHDSDLDETELDDDVPDGGVSSGAWHWSQAVSNTVYCFILLLAACAYPSLLSFAYLLAFLVVCIAWAAGFWQHHADYRLMSVKLCVLIFSGLHLILNYLYLFQFFQEGLAYDSIVARILGLNAVVTTDCQRPWDLKLRPDIKWTEYVSPVLILLAYWFSAISVVSQENDEEEEEQNLDTPDNSIDSPSGFRSRNTSAQASTRSTKQLVSLQQSRKREPSATDSVDGAGVSAQSMWRPKSMVFASTIQSDGQVVSVVYSDGREEVVDGPTEGLSATRVDGTDHPKEPTPASTKNSTIQPLYDFAVGFMYVLTLVDMMIWSIVYVSWLHFALLMAACVIWVLPDPGKMCPRLSPFLVFYATCLILLEYIFGLNLEDKELPQYDHIGLVRHDYPFPHLLLKVFFFFFILLSMRVHFNKPQYQSTKSETDQGNGNTSSPGVGNEATSASAAAGLGSDVQSAHLVEGEEALEMESFPSAPSAGGATGDGLRDEEAANTHEVTDLHDGDLQDGTDSSSDSEEEADGGATEAEKHWLSMALDFMQRYWILACLLVFVGYSLVPDVSVFKIVFMAFFLFFIVTKQFSGDGCGILLTLLWYLSVLYSMVVVAMLYTYQFDYIETYWNRSVSEDWVVDIGMEGFAEKHNGTENDGFIDGKEFSELLLPLVILIFAIIQTHYFYSPLPQEFLDQQAETRRDRKLLKKEADRQRKLKREAGGSRHSKSKKRGATVNTSDPGTGTVSSPSGDVAASVGVDGVAHEVDAGAHTEPPSSAAAAAATAAVLAGESTSDQSPKGSTSEGPNDSESSGGALTFLARFVRVVLDVVNWLVRFLLALVTWFFVLLIRVLDIHINKIILLVVLIVSLEEVCAVNLIAVIFVCLAVVLPNLTSLSYFVFHIWVAVSIIAKMGFQLRSVREYKPEAFSFSNCTSDGGTTLLYQDDAAWLGLLHMPNFSQYIQGYLWIVVLMALRIAIYRYQGSLRDDYSKKKKKLREMLEAEMGTAASHETSAGEALVVSSADQSANDKADKTVEAVLKELHMFPVPDKGLVFTKVSREEADENVLKVVQYMVNNFFEVFGKEALVVVCGIVVAVRVDGIAIVYGIILGLLISPARRLLAGTLTILVGLLVLLQYLLVLGVPPGVCYIRDGYPWSSNRSALEEDFAHFFYLPNPMNPQNKWLLVGDFFLLLCLSIQWLIYRRESRDRRAAQQQAHRVHHSDSGPTGSGQLDHGIGVPDFTSGESWLDLCKVFIMCSGLSGNYNLKTPQPQLQVTTNSIFQHFFWITLAIVFFAGTARNSIFCLGYLCFTFVFLWAGTSQLVDGKDKPRKRKARASSTTDGAVTERKKPKVLLRWTILLWYTYGVIILKTLFQIWVCIDFGHTLSCEENTGSITCVFASLLSVVCLKPVDSVLSSEFDSTVVDPTGLTLDVVSLGLLLVQLRIFNSPYFLHVQNHLGLFDQFANNGVRLMNKLLEQRRATQDEREAKLLADITTRCAELEADPDKFQILFGGTLVPEVLAANARGLLDKPLIEKRSELKTKVHTATSGDTPDGGVMGDDEDETDELDDIDGPVTPVPEEKFDKEEKERERTTLQRLRKALEHFFDKTVIQWLDEVSLDYLYVETRLRRLMYLWKERERPEQAGNEDAGTVPADLAPRGTSIKAFVNQDEPGDEHTRAVAEPGRTASFIKKVFKRSTSIVDSSKYTAVAIGDPIFRLLRHGQPVPKGERAAATEKLLREELADVIYVPAKFGWALYYAILARTDVFCYFVMILDHIVSGHILTMPLPFFVFLFGMMSKPRPSPRFWSFVIIYIQFVIIIKYIFQSHLVSSNLSTTDKDKPLYPPRIFGVESHSNFSRAVAADLVVLLALCIHRALLRFHGFWRTDVPNESEDAHSPTGGFVSTDSIDPDNSLDHNSIASRPAVDRQASLVAPSTLKKDRRKRKKKPSLWDRFVKRLKVFYTEALDPKRGGGSKDYYTLMFLFDLLTFLITIFGWSSFAEKSTSASADVTTYISQNYVPRTFLAMILIQFLLLIVDRVIYLWKKPYAKFVFQVVLLIAVHVWMFIVLPYITERPFTDNPVAQLWYFCKCVYFAVSAMQLAAGYPTRILGQFLTKDANIVTAALFLGVQAIPFLLELRELLDWACTRTVLGIMYWFKVQDIWSSVFVIKSFRHFEKSSPRKLGKPVGLVVKALVGGLGVVGIILLLWFPLVLMSLINSTSLSNPPTSVTVQLQIGGFQPLFHFTADTQFLQRVSESELRTLASRYQSPLAVSFIAKYMSSDVTRVSIPGQSSAVWGISPPTRDLMQAGLSDRSTQIGLTFQWTINREPNTGLAAETVTQVNASPLPANSTARTLLAEVLNTTSPTSTTTLERLFPTFILAPANGAARAITELNDSWVDVDLRLLQGDRDAEWWSLSQVSPRVLDTGDGSNLELYIVSDRVAAPVFSFLAGYGVIGLYVSLVLVVGQFLRLIFKNISHRIIYEDMPDPDALHKLCHNIFMARESGRLQLEERLVGQLFLLYRSPERLVELTRARPGTYKEADTAE